MKKQSSLILFVSLFLSLYSVDQAQQDLFGVQIRASSRQSQDRWQLFNHINNDSTVPNPFATIFNATGTATQIGTTDYTDGLGTPQGSINGIWSLGNVGNLDDVEVTPYSITSVSLNESIQAGISWESETGFTFHVECNPSLDGQT
ncbi:hypothetical protein F7C95_05315 [Opitutia bacterium ISCC 51]|nr:hypothetical protein F7C95_05315 [Opitutae bacterium ISCC 51]QXD29387.1 hypothetical protein GA003_05295 [Opitutae bacterium ISCC 52]